MKLFTIFTLLVIANYSLVKEPRVFCRYNHQGLSKVFDPAYEDENGKIVYA